MSAADLLTPIVIYGVWLFVAYRYTAKTGKSPWWSALILIPGIGWIAFIYVIAFGGWRVDDAHV